jgi:hypothetical protein
VCVCVGLLMCVCVLVNVSVGIVAGGEKGILYFFIIKLLPLLSYWGCNHSSGSVFSLDALSVKGEAWVS